MIELKYDNNNLIPAIIQDYKTNEVLMLGYMNEDSIKKMLSTGKTCFYSRSRNKFWLKGETSGHFQHVKEIFTDCDRDTLLIKVEQISGACHEGYRSCFYQKMNNDMKTIKIVGERLFDPKETYKKE